MTIASQGAHASLRGVPRLAFLLFHAPKTNGCSQLASTALAINPPRSAREGYAHHGGEDVHVMAGRARLVTPR